MNVHLRLWREALVALTIGLMILIAGPAATGQNPPPSSSGPSSGQSPAPQAGPTADSYAVSLSTGEPIYFTTDQDATSRQLPGALSEYADGFRARREGKKFRRELFYGVSLASAYVSDYRGLGIGSQLSTTVSPYLALLMPTKNGSLILQYDAVVNPHDTSVLGSGAQAYQAFSLTAQGALTRRWSWMLFGTSSYGSQAARVEGPSTFSLVHSVPVLDASSTVLLQATDVLLSTSTGRLTFQRNERNSFGFTVVHSYTGISGNPNNPSAPGEYSNTADVRVEYTHLTSSRLALTTYGEEETLFGASTCYAYGAGLGFSAKLSRAVSLAMEGGPNFASPGCGGQKSGDFKAVLTGQLNRKDRVYASLSRVFTPAYQVNGTWQDSAGVGFSKNLARTTLATDAGFVHETLTNAAAYRGYFVSPRIHFKIVNSLGFTASYKVLHAAGGRLSSGNLNFAVVSLDWYPAGLRF